MRSAQGLFQLSATDLSNHLACGHLTILDIAAAEKRLEVPHRHSAYAAMLRERGLLHERAYLDHLGSRGLRITNLEGAGPEQTLAAMAAGAHVIYQASLAAGTWQGRADVL